MLPPPAEYSKRPCSFGGGGAGDMVPRAMRARSLVTPVVAWSMILLTASATAQPRRRPQPAPQEGVITSGPNPTVLLQQAEARRHFQTGGQHYQAGRFAAAIEEFRLAYNLYASPTILFNMAQAYRSDGQLVNAVATFRRYLEDATGQLTDTQRAEVEAVIQEIESSRAVLSFEVEPAGVTVTLDGRELGTTPLPRGVEVMPGEHNITLRLTDHDPHDERITVGAHERRLYQYLLRPIERNARISITTVPSNASIRFDGQEVNRGSYSDRIRPGEHEVRVEAEGYLPETRRITVGVLRSDAIQITLQPRPRSILTRWWFWTAIGGAVALGVTLGIVLNPSEPAPIAGNGDPAVANTLFRF